MDSMPLNIFLLSALALIFSIISLFFSLAAIAWVVGLKNSTHKIEWKTYDPYAEEDDETPIESLKDPEEVDDEPMYVNPNKKIKREPFVPFPPEPKEEDPFVDAEDPNNIVHDFRK